MEIDQFPRVPTLLKFSFCQIGQFPYQIHLYYPCTAPFVGFSYIIIWNYFSTAICWFLPALKYLANLEKKVAFLPEIMAKKQSSVPKSQPLLSNFSSTHHNWIGALFISDCPQCSYLHRTEKASAESGKAKCTK